MNFKSRSQNVKKKCKKQTSKFVYNLGSLFQPYSNQQTSFNAFKHDNMFQCLYCPLGYSSATLLERHIRQHHGHLAGVAALTGSMPGLGSRPVNPEMLGKQQSPLMISNFQYLPNKGIYHAKPIRPRPTKSAATLMTLQEKIRQNIRRENASRSPSGMYRCF